MYIVIVGAGEVGFHIATVLIQEGHDVAVIDRDPERYRTASEELDALVLLGNGASKSTLREANIARANILIAVTDADEVNMVACMAAKHVGVPLTIARIRSVDYLDDVRSVSREFTGIDYVIQPEGAVAEEVAKLAEFPGAVDVGAFADEQVTMAEIQVDPQSEAVGKPLMALGLPRNVLLTAVLRGDSMSIPTGDTTLREADRVFLVGKRQGVLKAAAMLSLHMRPTRRAILLGCGEMGMRIARLLEERDIRLTIFEKDERRALEAASQLRKALVLHDEGIGESVLLQEGVEGVDLFIAATGDDRLNILASLQAKRLGAARTIAIVERAEFSAILQSVGVDAAISPRRITASTILGFIRSGDVLSVALLERSAGEVLEVVVAEGSAVAGKRLRDIRFPADAIVGVLVQADGVHVAHGSSVPQPGDRAIVFALPEVVPEVEKLFAH
ncbi:MAG: Trk system potassium transporter TrkA [Thermoleophilia bacterium]|nr:Trk system potassium transporter TrkA [Thermoleophilia bacterium]